MNFVASYMATVIYSRMSVKNNNVFSAALPQKDNPKKEKPMNLTVMDYYSITS